MRLSDCDQDETTVLVAIVALAQQLPDGELNKYTRALGEIRENYFGVPGRQRYVASRAVTEQHQIRARALWQ